MKITDIQIDALKEIINIGVGRSASSLNKILNKRISLQIPVIEPIEISEVESKLAVHKNDNLSIVKMTFKGQLVGLSELVFSTKGASNIVSIVNNEEEKGVGLDNQMKVNVLSEIGNMILNALIGTIGNLLKTRIRYSLPQYLECKTNQLVKNVSVKNAKVIYAETLFKVVDEDITGSFIIFLEVDSFDKLMELIDAYLKK